MMEKQLVYLGGTTIDNAEQEFPCMKVSIFHAKKKKQKTKYCEYHFSVYVHLHRKVDLGKPAFAY